jgi:hemerythrin-like domain-containing protein
VPDVVALIKSQHRELEELLEQAEQEDTDTLALLAQVATLLKPHSEAEESYVYPRIAELQEDEADEVHDGTAEHHHADALLDELLAGDPDEPGYDGKLAALIGELKHHIEEEETELLTVLTEKADDAERQALGNRFAADTGSAEVRPDADASSSGEATKAELYELAKEQDVPGRSTMTKDELASAVTEES